MKTITSLLAIALATLPCALADQPASQQMQHEEKKPRIPEMDGLIKAIHLDLKQLKKTHPWLSGYDDKALLSNDSIYFMERPAFQDENTPQPQQPSHISITYGRIKANKHNAFKYDNNLEDVPACQFPTLKLKVYAQILVRGVKNAETADAIRNCIIKRCEAQHKAMENSRQTKPANPDENQRDLKASRKRGEK